MPALSRLSRFGLPTTFGAAAAGVGLLAGIDPRLAIAAALSVGVLLVMLSDLYVGLLLFTVLSFVAEIPSAGPALSAAKIAGLLLAISWIATLATRQDASADFTSVHPVLTFVLVLLVSWIALSQLWADQTAPAMDTLFRLSLNAILLLIIFTAVRTPGQAVGVITAFVSGATFAAIYGLLFVAPEGTEQAARLAGTLANPNELATVLVAALTLSLGLAGALSESPLARLGALGAASICAAAVFLTGSRGGLLALAVALLAFLLTGSRFRGRLLLVTIAVVVAGVGYYNYVASPEARGRVTDVESGSGRTDLWQIAWRMVEAEPVHGVGAGNFQTASPRFLLESESIERSEFFIGGRPKVVHNTYLEIWAEQGTVGLVLFLFVVGFGLYAGAKATRAFARQGDQRMEVIARAVFVALAAVLAADFFGSRYFNKELWLLLGLAAAMWAIARKHEGRRSA